jgi:hypothetical protein
LWIQPLAQIKPSKQCRALAKPHHPSPRNQTQVPLQQPVTVTWTNQDDVAPEASLPRAGLTTTG